MASLSYNIHKTFSTIIQTYSKFWHYVLITWFLRASLISVALTLDELSILPINYAKNNICWIGNSVPLMVYFMLPMSLVMLWNMFFFSKSVFHICVLTKNTSTAVPNSDDKKTLYVLMKLSSLMGFSWVFGILVYLTDHNIVWSYLFVIFTSLQGIYIALSFAVNKTVFSMIAIALGEKTCVVFAYSACSHHLYYEHAPKIFKRTVN